MEDAKEKELQAKQDEGLINDMAINLFFEWTDSLTKEGRETEAIKRFCERSGATDNSPAVMMFEAFCGGLCKGIELMLPKENEEDQEEAFSLEEQERDEEAYFSAFGDDMLVVEDRGQGHEA